MFQSSLSVGVTYPYAMMLDDMEQVETPKVSEASSSPPWICVICGDWGSGNHYGALTCFGCKGFFLRAVKSKHKLICLEEENCEITKDKRKQCRYCRMQKCLKNGMKIEAVRTDRRGEGQPKKKVKDCESNTEDEGMELCVSLLNHIPRPRDNGVVTFLINAESFARTVANIVEPSYGARDIVLPEAGGADVIEAFRHEVYEIVEWAKQLSPFKDLNLKDQLSILRSHALDLVILEWVRRSLPLQGAILTGNGKRATVENAHHAESALIRSRVLNELAEPLKALTLDDTDFACLKPLIFFDPQLLDAGEGKDSVGATRYQIQVLLEEHTRSDIGKLSSLLMLLPRLYCIRTTMIELLKGVQAVRGEEFPRLIKEVVLGEDVK